MTKIILPASMEPLKARISDSKGITLIELLATVAIMGILMPVIYGAYMTGYQVYEKIAVQSQLREDADYVSSMMMQALYSQPFDDVSQCQSPSGSCLEIKQDYETSIDAVGKSNLYDITQKTAQGSFTIIQTIPDENGEEIKIGNTQLHTDADFTGSTFTVHCTEGDQVSDCKNGGTIELNLKVSNDKNNQTLNLNSEFGF